MCLLAVLAPSFCGSGGWDPKQMDPIACGREVLHKIHHQLICFARTTVTQINQSLERIRRCFIHQLLPSLALLVLSWMAYRPRKAANFDFHTFLPWGIAPSNPLGRASRSRVFCTEPRESEGLPLWNCILQDHIWCQSSETSCVLQNTAKPHREILMRHTVTGAMHSTLSSMH